MTEIAFLLDLVLNHKMSKDAKERCIKRIGEVEARMVIPVTQYGTQYSTRTVSLPTQAPSTQALLDANPIVLAQTPTVAAALQSRAELIASAGKTEPGRTSPRKF